MTPVNRQGVPNLNHPIGATFADVKRKDEYAELIRKSGKYYIVTNDATYPITDKGKIQYELIKQGV